MNFDQSACSLGRFEADPGSDGSAIRAEYQRSREQILHAADCKSLLEENPPLAQSLASRNPCLDPLNSIQVALLRRIPAMPEAAPGDNAWIDPLLRSINAIAAGMRNTG